MRPRPGRMELSAVAPAPIVLAPNGTGGEPHTTSEIIAEGTGMNHRRVRDAIRKYQTELETFGVVFKQELVRQFYTMRDELAKRQERGAGRDAHAVDILTAAELEVYQRKEAAIAVLLDAGLCYDTIKAALAGKEAHKWSFITGCGTTRARPSPRCGPRCWRPGRKGEERAVMTAPRLRTAEGALEIIKAGNPETAVTLRHIRRLIATGTAPHIPVGRKKLVNVDKLLIYLGKGPKEAARGATNTTSGKAGQSLTDAVSASEYIR